MTENRDQNGSYGHKSDRNVEMSPVLLAMAREAGVSVSDEIELMERIGARGFVANYKELLRFAQLVGEKAREDERRKYEHRTKPNAKRG